MSGPGVVTRPLSVTVMAHLTSETAIGWRVHDAEDRVTVRLENEDAGGSNMTLFADRAELVRLHEALGALVAELDQKRAALAQRLQADESAA